eukprot:TRINITY_DN47230_c0_g1_i1.p1 TRINITY_DN47230_c0_g1~~TRINITY_DN47230_c0_g1_i1.p1  ORF type:complete len:492 (+),score=96.48 TRINITY_DN47230_c0_g1_i1:142-1617(+)
MAFASRGEDRRGTRTFAVSTILDGRTDSVGARAELFRLWVLAQREVLSLKPHNPSEMCVITLQEGSYEACLPLGRHTAAESTSVLDRLEAEWVHGPLGLTAQLSSGGQQGQRSGPSSESQATATTTRAGATGRPQPGARGAKRSHQAAFRLFSVGEDTAVAALRSAATQLTAGRPADAALSSLRLEFWTTQPEKLVAAAESIAGVLLPNVQVAIFAVPGSKDSLEQAQRTAAKLREELDVLVGVNRTYGLRCSNVEVVALPMTAAAFVRQARKELDVCLPCVLRLPPCVRSACKDIRLSASPAVVLPLALRSDIVAALSGCDIGATVFELEVLSRIPATGISCELLYGVPLILAVAEQYAAASHAGGPSDAERLFGQLLEKMAAEKSCLLLAARINPMNLCPGQVRYFFIATVLQHDSRGCDGAAPSQLRLALRGCVFADIWSPSSQLGQDVGEMEKVTEQTAGGYLDQDSAAAAPRFDAFMSCGEFAICR